MSNGKDCQGDGFPDGVLQNTIMIQDPTQNDYLWFQGTSMASPHAAGVAALVVSQGVNNPNEVERILKETADHPNKVLSRDQLLNLAHNRDWEPFDRSIDIRIARIRRKIERDPAKPQVIKTVRGAGYRMSSRE